jgi:hypothetical protein
VRVLGSLDLDLNLNLDSTMDENGQPARQQFCWILILNEHGQSQLNSRDCDVSGDLRVTCARGLFVQERHCVVNNTSGGKDNDATLERKYSVGKTLQAMTKGLCASTVG